MKGSVPRFRAPIDSSRPRGARLLEAFSLKLNRPVRLFDRWAFQHWIALEADCDVLAFCERPARLGSAPAHRYIDFWVRYAEREVMEVIQRTDARPVTPDRIDDIPVHVVVRAELAAAAAWTSNWQQMLPAIVAARSQIPAALRESIEAAITEPIALSRIERQFASGDPALTRAAVFDLLRTGRLRATSLRTAPLSLVTLLEPPS